MSSDPDKMMSKADKMYAFLSLLIYVNVSVREVNDRWKLEFESGFRAFWVNRDDCALMI